MADLHTTVSEATMAQIRELAADRGHGTQRSVIEKAVDRMYREEVEMNELGMIDITVSEDLLFGGCVDMELYNAEQSVIEYTELLSDRLMQELGCPISVTSGDVGRVVISHDMNGEIRRAVDEISAEIYEEYRWVRYTREGVDANLDTGFWTQVRNGVIAGASEIETDDGISWQISYHKGAMPAYDHHNFDSKEALLDKMADITDFEFWVPREN